MYRTIDLCAGIGGIRKGFERTKHFTNVLSAENDEYAAQTYEYIFGENPRADLTKPEFKEEIGRCKYDVLLAGFPCQPFSSQGNLEGFKDPTKGTIFFHIKEIIENTRPKVVFLENVQNIISHDKKRTIKIIIDTFEKKLNYKVIGVTYDNKGNCIYNSRSFIRNTRDFGLPQNRPRAFFVAFDRELYGDLTDLIDNSLPEKLSEKLERNCNLNHDLREILESKVDIHYYLSASYLNTLEEHAKRQRENGNGFGYFILNSKKNNRSYSNAILATGGSGKERNLIIQKMPRVSKKEIDSLRKKGGLNKKNVRIMTPTEWGRLQGFIGYAFVNEDTGVEEFAFPDSIPESQQYKQFGNSVSIPVVETIADYIYEQISIMNRNHITVLKNLDRRDGFITRKTIADCLDIEPSSASHIIRKLRAEGLIKPEGAGKNTKYHFM